MRSMLEGAIRPAEQRPRRQADAGRRSLGDDATVLAVNDDLLEPEAHIARALFVADDGAADVGPQRRDLGIDRALDRPDQETSIDRAVGQLEVQSAQQHETQHHRASQYLEQRGSADAPLAWGAPRRRSATADRYG